MTNKSVSKASQPATARAGDYTRLHISPLDPQLLKIIVPGAILLKARDISYHTLQTFPDKPYGFVELPSADAEKIKNKLNGAVLKGNKIRIEPARPDDMPKPSDDAVADADANAASGADTERKSKKSKASKKDKKRKRDPQEIVGVELEEGRKVKRGWTLTPEEAKSKKKKEKEREKKEKNKNKKPSSNDKKERTRKKREPESEYTEGPECLVKTRLPPNKRDIVVDTNGAGAGAGDDGSERKKKSRKHKHEVVVVHEFENNSKFPTFLKASSNTSTSGAPSEFVEGKGWVDDKGQVVEEVKSTRPQTFPKIQVEKKKQAVVTEDDTSSSSGSSDEEEEEEEEDEDDEKPEIVADPGEHSVAAPEPGLNLRTIPAGAGSDVQSESASPRPKSPSSATNLTIRIPPTTPSPTKVHPLEALYKRQRQEDRTGPKTADAEPFNFFGGDDIEDEEDDGVDGALKEDAEESSHPGYSQGLQLPMTPFSKQDFESRGVRSAAPTPDTAHPSRFSRSWSLRGERDGPSDVEEEVDNDGTGSSKEGRSDDEAGDGPANPNTDFQKWFWEHRGDLNRSWKKRRKTAAKEKRYRENRARADKAI